VECEASIYSKFTNLTHLVPSVSLPKGSWRMHWKTLPGFDKGRHCTKKPTYQSTRVYPTEATSSRNDIREGPLEGPRKHQDASPSSLRVLGRKSIQPPGSRTKVRPASGFQDESLSSLWVPGRKTVQPLGSRTKVHPASGIASTSHEFQKDVSLGLRILGKHAQDPPGSKKARHKAILALIVAYLRGKIAILHMAKNQWQSSTRGSTFSIQRGHYRSPQTTCPKILLRYQESTRLSLSTKTNMLNVPPTKSQGTILRRGKKLQLQHQNLKKHQAEARPTGSSMRILSFGLWVVLNLLIPLILSLAKILPLRILGSSTSIWGMRRSITLYANVPGFSI
ncbi:LOW QUALITY PROTEIN: hypothetical protein HID58_055666, partial [Brassica napus]